MSAAADSVHMFLSLWGVYASLDWHNDKNAYDRWLSLCLMDRQGELTHNACSRVDAILDAAQCQKTRSKFPPDTLKLCQSLLKKRKGEESARAAIARLSRDDEDTLFPF